MNLTRVLPHLILLLSLALSGQLLGQSVRDLQPASAAERPRTVGAMPTPSSFRVSPQPSATDATAITRCSTTEVDSLLRAQYPQMGSPAAGSRPRWWNSV